MHHAVTFNINTDSLGGFTDTYIVSLWHVAQANPAPLDDRAAGELTEHIGREIIRRFIQSVGPELWAHQGNHHYWHTLIQHCKVVDGEWVPKSGESAEVASRPEQTLPPACRDCQHVRRQNSLYPECATPIAEHYNSVTGEYKINCRDMRQEGAACGPDGRLFQIASANVERQPYEKRASSSLKDCAHSTHIAELAQSYQDHPVVRLDFGTAGGATSTASPTSPSQAAPASAERTDGIEG